MAISKAEHSESVMIAGRHINHVDGRIRQTVVHGHGKIPVVETVRIFINEHISLGIAHHRNVRSLLKHRIFGMGEKARPVVL